MLAEMYWKGTGVAQDRPRGYAWMDFAAQRRFPNFVILRERYWSSLDAPERARAIDVGRPLMDEYGDYSGGPRLAQGPQTGRASRRAGVGQVVGNYVAAETYKKKKN